MHWWVGGSGVASKWRAKIPPKVRPLSVFQPQPSKVVESVYVTMAKPQKLVPLELGWEEGRRYALAGCCEARSRLDCYVEDPNGPWKRLAGVLQITAGYPTVSDQKET